MTGFGEAFARFDAELDAAVSRARRVSAEARADSARFRAETGRLVQSVHDRTLVARREELTSEELREQATRFRTEQGLPVEQLPSAGELAEAGMLAEERPVRPHVDEDDDFSQDKILSAPGRRDEPGQQPLEQAPPPSPPPSPQPPARGRRRPVPRTSDDDEDFSQERILYNG